MSRVRDPFDAPLPCGTRCRVLTWLAMAALGLCTGCSTVSEFESPLVELGDERFQSPEWTDSGVPNEHPEWATEPPRLDLLGDDCQTFSLDHCPPATIAPQRDANSLHQCEISDITTGTSCQGCPNCRPNPNQPWGRPRDEYICDGGDGGTRVRVRSNWQIDGLQMEDTIAHFDTLAGEVGIVPSNKACVYAPWFAAVRKITRVNLSQMNEMALDAREMTRPAEERFDLEAGAVKQPVATVRAVGTSIGTTMEELQKGLLVEDVTQPIVAQDKLLPFEDLQVIEYGVLARSDIPTLMEGVAAAHVWSTVEMAQVLIDQQLAFEQKGVGQAQAEVVYESPKGKPRLKLVKLASQCDAQPGDVVDFTIRFDNVGDLLIGNVTIVDKLTTRLKYIDNSQNCSVEAAFIEDESSDALVLRWEVDEPLRPGEGGVIRFQCEVQ